MLVRKLSVVLTLTILLVGGQVEMGLTDRGQILKKEPPKMTEIFRVMGKGVDYIVVGEQSLYVVPATTKITDLNGTAIDLARLRTPCLAEVTYLRYYKGLEQQPVVLYLRVKKYYRGASSKISRE